MAKVVTGMRRSAGGLVLPRSAESRVVNLELHIPAGVGATDFAFTSPLGNNIWLLRVDAWFLQADGAPFIGGFVYIAAGSGTPAAGGVIALQWDLIVPNYNGAQRGLWWHGVDGHLSWDMSRLYQGDSRRFGAVIENHSAVTAWIALISFLISEG